MHGADDDVAAIAPTPKAKLAGGLLAGAGVFTVVLALQSWLLIMRVPIYVWFLVMLKVLLGPAAVILGFNVTRMRGWAMLAGAAAGGSIAFTAMIWAVFTLLNGVLSLLALTLIPAALAAATLCVLCVPEGRRADAARSRLRDQGLEAGM
jgi:hypothetical protein